MATLQKRRIIEQLLIVLALFFGVLGSSTTLAKGGGKPIRLCLTFDCPDVIVRAHAEPGDHMMIVVDKSYLGPFSTERRLFVAEPEPAKDLVAPLDDKTPSSKTILYLFLKHTPETAHPDYPNVIGWDWTIDWGLSERLSDAPAPVTKKPNVFTLHPPPPSREFVEKEIAQGLARHERWHAAQVESDPSRKLALLQPFLVTGGEAALTPYELWSSSSLVLDEVAKTGETGVDFLHQLLKLPCYQDNYEPDGWRGFGAQERAFMLKSLALQEFHAASTPEEKLAKLHPLFDLPSFTTDAGYDQEGLLGVYMDRGLAAVIETGSEHAAPFLRGLLQLPQFQESYSPPMRKDFGHDQRVKIEDTLAGLK